MSLAISLRIPDGIVVAADSLSTAKTNLEFAADFKLECPECNKQISLEKVKLPPFGFPRSASSYTQKLFPLFEKYAITSHGVGIINEMSIYWHINRFAQLNKNSVPENLDTLVSQLESYFDKELLAQFPKYKDEAPDGWAPLNLQINGFEYKNEKYTAVTHELKIGKKNDKNKHVQSGCTIGGFIHVVTKLWETEKKVPDSQINFGLFSLQDAVDYCEYLIRLTTGFQRFSNIVPTVGGDIDIALLTPFHGFKWIKRKDLSKVLEGP